MSLTGEYIWKQVSARLRLYIGETWDSTAIADSTGSKVTTVADWIFEIQPPVGERLIKLWHFLAALDFESPELATLDEYNRYIGELLTFSVVDISDLQDILSVRNAQTVLQILRGQSPAAPKLQLTELKELYHDQLVTKKSECLKKATPYIHKRGSPTPVSAPEPPAETVKSAEPKAVLPVPISDTVATAAALIGALLPLLRIIASDQISPATRSKLREYAGNEIFEGSNLMSALCSERARDQLRRQR